MSGRTSVLKKVFTKVALLQMSTLIGAMLVLGISVRNRVHDVYLNSLSIQLSDLVEVLTRQIPAKVDEDWCRKASVGTQFRLSVISAEDGHLFCDNTDYPERVQFVLDRPEIQSALHSVLHRGHSMRLSQGLNRTQGVYSTAYLPEQKVIVRSGLPLKSLTDNLTSLDRMFFAAIVAISLILVAILQWTTRGILYAQASREVSRAKKKMQEDFIANVSHEFRTPLTSIRGFSEAAIQDLKAGRATDLEFMEIIYKDSGRLLSMVNDLLDLSSIHAGALALNKEEVAVADLTEEVLKRLLVVYGYKNFNISTHFDTEWALADPNRLLQILINLVGNSMKYCPSGSKIEIRWSKAEGEGTQLVVADAGPGIPEQVKARMFQRFARAESESESTGGSGLGLAIVKGLVDAHEGTIDLESLEGQGTRFIVKFPVFQPQSAS